LSAIYSLKFDDNDRLLIIEFQDGELFGCLNID